MIVLVVSWATVAGFNAQTREDRKYAWGSLVDAMIHAETSRVDNLRVYAFEDYVATPMQFHLDAAHEGGFRVVQVSDISALEGDHFWVVFRDASWRQTIRPQEILTEKGYQVGQGFRSRMYDQQVELFPVWRR